MHYPNCFEKYPPQSTKKDAMPSTKITLFYHFADAKIYEYFT
jgi:hypothetical protein